MNSIKVFVGGLTEIALLLLALAIALRFLVGAQLPFVGDVTSNLMSYIKDLGANGLIGLITLGFVIWLFSHRQVS